MSKEIPENLQKRVDAGMGCGSFIPDGWFDIVVKLNEDITKIDPYYKVDQIKEKFGTLRYYVTLSEETTGDDYDRINDLIYEAENKSSVTCDQCGAPANLDSSGHWLRTICDECKNKLHHKHLSG